MTNNKSYLCAPVLAFTIYFRAEHEYHWSTKLSKCPFTPSPSRAGHPMGALPCLDWAADNEDNFVIFNFYFKYSLLYFVNRYPLEGLSFFSLTRM